MANSMEAGMKRLFLLVWVFAIPTIGPTVDAQERRRPSEVIVIPTLRQLHQYNMDYTVAHLAALLDAISPSALVVQDSSDWLSRECIVNNWYPENHVKAKRHVIGADR